MRHDFHSGASRDIEPVIKEGFSMSRVSNATAEVFVTAFRALPKSERDEVLVRIAADRSLRRDLLDLATIAERRTEPSRSFREYLNERKK